MKTTLTLLIAACLTISAPTTWAGGRHEGHGGYPGYYGGHGYYAGHGHRYYGHRHYRGHHDNDEWAYLLGGLVLGGLVTHAYHRQQEAVQAVPAQGYYAVPNSGQRLVRDAYGNCYTSTFDAAGTEYRTPADPALCNW